MDDDTQPWCKACRWSGMTHCSEVQYCGQMKDLPRSDPRVVQAFEIAPTDRKEALRLMNEVWDETPEEPPYSPWWPNNPLSRFKGAHGN